MTSEIQETIAEIRADMRVFDADLAKLEEHVLAIKAMRSMKWIDAKVLPKPTGDSYLVMLKPDNDYGFTSYRPIIAEFGMYRNKDVWTTYLDTENLDINDDVIWYMPLPNPPKEE